MKKTLIINEKRDQSEKLADAMGWTKGSNCFEGTFNGKPVECVWASGHLHTLIAPDEIDTTLKWSDEPTKLLPIPRDFKIRLIDNPSLPKPIQASFLFNNITKRLRYVDEIIIATDADREGEAIGRNIIKESNFKGKIKRAWLAAGLDKKSLTSAMANLKGEFDTIGWHRAAEARGRSDWAYQYLVRAYTFYSKYGKFGSYLGQGKGSEGVMSVGRLQTVIVSMIVQRESEIKNFVSKNHYTLSADFNFQGESFNASFSPKVTETLISDQPPGVTWEPQKVKDGNTPLDKPLFTDKEIVENYKKSLLAKASESYVYSYNESIEKESPPNAYSLTDAQKEIGKLCGTNATLTQVILEDLYEQGWISYARTSKSELPLNLYDPAERNVILGNLQSLPFVAKEAAYVKDLHDGKLSDEQPFKPRAFVTKAMEHYGMIPTQQPMSVAKLSTLSPRKKSGKSVLHTADQMRIAYEAIAKRYVQLFYPQAEFAVQSVQINVPVRDILGNTESVFKAKGRTILKQGWRQAFPKSSSKETVLPRMSKDERGTLEAIKTKKSRTRPPSRYNSVSLPKELELVGKNVADPKLRKLLANAEGIGRPATRSSAIETVLKRRYALCKDEEFHATQKGIDLIKFVPKWLSTPETSALWEDYLNKIESQTDDQKACQMRDNFVSKQIEKIEDMIRYMNDKFLGNLGEKSTQVGKNVTPKMKSLIKKLEEIKGIKAPRGTLNDPYLANAFIQENIGERQQSGGSNAPTEGTIKFVKDIAAALPDDIEFDDGILEDRNKCKKFIDDYKKYLPPTSNQLKFLDSIIAKLPVGTNVPEDVRKHSYLCSEFINKNK
ncbi:DNA topoisomerase [Pseudoalteromonas sp. OFAV1]|uniref:DNA topoisomerase n=1 Tax=Pseudoalteromonas sp. OFAV1 TaxID=2908892 RepID=UPI001F2A3C61|nr:DNA topoisomerase [Pseudoalteromonas sp. OFAV1]MCF2901845.1 DNA topoisomerase [Pseudoalteromonas sp. OFAV1]